MNVTQNTESAPGAMFATAPDSQNTRSSPVTKSGIDPVSLGSCTESSENIVALDSKIDGRETLETTAGHSSSPGKTHSEMEGKISKATRRSRRSTAHDTCQNADNTDVRSNKMEDQEANSPTASTASEMPATPIADWGTVTAPNMIFAYYMGKTRAYYPAVCLGPGEDSQQYKIKWPGYEAENVAVHGICALDLRVGDEVKIDREGFPKSTFLVRRLEASTDKSGDEVTDVYGHNRALVVPKQRKSLMSKLSTKEESVPVSSLYIDLAMWNRISKRPSLYRQQPKADDILLCTPRARTSTPSTPSCRSRKFIKDQVIQVAAEHGSFGGMVFALTFESDTIKEKVNKLIQSNGGIVLAESFADLFDEHFNLRSEYNSVGFTALITDRHSRKGKYMQALALGLPCLNSRWIEASVGDPSYLENWQDYLLPAGECAELGGAIRSRTLPSMTIADVKLLDSFASRKSFFGTTQIVFVMGKSKTEKRKEQRDLHLFFVQAMTPTGKVEVASDLDTASEILQKLDRDRKIWLVVADEHRHAAEARVEQIKQDTLDKSSGKGSAQHRPKILKASNGKGSWDIEVADSEFVIQSLILGRLCRR